MSQHARLETWSDSTCNLLADVASLRGISISSKTFSNSPVKPSGRLHQLVGASSIRLADPSLSGVQHPIHQTCGTLARVHLRACVSAHVLFRFFDLFRPAFFTSDSSTIGAQSEFFSLLSCHQFVHFPSECSKCHESHTYDHPCDLIQGPRCRVQSQTS